MARLSWLTHRHTITAAEVANVTGTFWTFGRHGTGISEGYNGPKAMYKETPWRIHAFTSWLVDQNGLVKQGQVVSVGEMAGGLGDQYLELASAVQGPSVKVRFLSDVGYEVTHGLYVFLWNPLTAGDLLYTRIKYGVVR